MENVHVVVATDNTYAQHVGVLFVSLLEHKQRAYALTLHVIDGGISADNIEKLQMIARYYQVTMRIIRPDRGRYQEMTTSHRFGEASFYRISMPDLLDVGIEKAIYLDSDLIVKQDILQLWEIDISEHMIAAVVDYDLEKPKRPTEYKARFGISTSEKYFNSGVLLLNLRRWREEHTSNKVLAYLLEFGATLDFPDQDALNAVLHEKCLFLPPCWNQQPYVYRLGATDTIMEQQVIDLVRAPYIIHYLGRIKPWSCASSHPLRLEYYRYLALSPWKAFHPTDQTLGNYLTRMNGLFQNNLRYLRYRSPFAQLFSPTR